MAIDCRDLASLLDSYTEHKRTSAPAGCAPDARSSTCRSTTCRRARGLSAGTCAARRRADQLRSDPRHGAARRSHPGSDSQKDAGARAKVAQRKQGRAERHKAIRARQAENARKGWDDKPIRPGPHGHRALECGEGQELAARDAQPGELPRRHLAVPRRRRISGHNGGGGVGYGPGAMRAPPSPAATRDEFCVGLMGDGDFVMSSGAIWSAVHNRAPMLIVINNNTTWGNDEKHQIEVADERRRPVENAWIGQRMVEPDIDHATTARSYRRLERRARFSIRPSSPAYSRGRSPRWRRARSRWSRCVPSCCDGLCGGG